ncbi:hypothetical protein KCU92_g29, partial [Aureobasidium melanogenum]
MRSVQQILAETASQTFRTTSTAAMEVSCNKKILVDEPRMNHWWSLLIAPRILLCVVVVLENLAALCSHIGHA